MLRYRKLPEDIEKRLNKTVQILGAYPDIIFAYIFGGLAKGKPTPLSDVDIAVFIKDSADMIENKMNILGILTDNLHTDEIDLVILNTASLPLTMRIIQNKNVIIDKIPFIRHSFESLKMRQYFDFSYNESSILRRRYLHG